MKDIPVYIVLMLMRHENLKIVGVYTDEIEAKLVASRIKTSYKAPIVVSARLNSAPNEDAVIPE